MLNPIADRMHSIKPDTVQGRPPLRIVPILGKSYRNPKYRLLEGEALAVVRVTEVSEEGHVQELKVENPLDTMLFLMDGQELIGAKQNRILNTDVLVAAKSTLTVPVSCVEAGRWRYSTATFSPGRAANYRVRARKMDRVHRALRQERIHDAEQGQVWEEVDETLAAACILRRPTSALHDAYMAQRDRLAEFRGSLQLPRQAVGLAMFHGPRFLGLDLFDRNSTLRYFWESLLDSYAIDWLEVVVEEPMAGPGDEDVQKLLRQAADGQWESFSSPGEGVDYRLNDAALTGSALLWNDEVVVHLQLFPKQANEARPQPIRRNPRIHRPYGPGLSHGVE